MSIRHFFGRAKKKENNLYIFAAMLDFDPVLISIPFFFALIALELLYNWYRTKRKGKKSLYRLNDSFSNISCGVVDQVTAVFSKVFVIGAYTFVFDHAQNWIGITIPESWAFYILMFIGVDFLYYWAHRLGHDVNLLWAGHVVHHQSEEYNLSVALRQGALQKVLTFWIYLPLAFLGFPPQWFLVIMGFNLIYQFWIHTEAINKMGVFELVFNTPSHHRVHHGRDPEYIDKNHAGVFIIWDKMFGTFQEEKQRPIYGITDPTETFNPVKAHIQPLSRLASGFREMPGIGNKIRFLLYSPAWRPKSMGGSIEVKKVGEGFKKFNLKLPLAINIYLLVQFAINVVVGSEFLKIVSTLTSGIKLIFLVYTLYYLVSLGSFFDKKKVAYFLEGFRHIALIMTSTYLLWNQNNDILVQGLMLVSVISLVWLIIINRKNYTIE